MHRNKYNRPRNPPERRASMGVELERARESLRESEERRAEDARRIEILLRMNHSLAQAASGTIDERSLMENALSAFTELVGALGCSFVPVDEWQQPLPPFTYGRLPEPVLAAWAAHLADGMLRERCASCRVRKSAAGVCPLHPEQVGEALTVQCLPLLHDDPAPASAPGEEDSSVPLGVLHFYLPPGRRIDPEMHSFLAPLLRGFSRGYQSARLRAQEISTQRQIQLLHAAGGNDRLLSLRTMLDGLRETFESSCILLRLLPSADERLEEITLQSGSCAGIDQLASQVMEQVLRGEAASSAARELPAWMALPVALPGRRAIGLLLAASQSPYEFQPRQIRILQTITTQAALLVENERLIRSVEYKAVIEERARLAREIHDGLAQTIAFLKLQVGQMQSYLAQGNLARLEVVLKENYQALAEAYLDTRQAIDNLRLTPQIGLADWLDRAVRELENTAGLHAETRIEQHAGARAAVIPLEIQVQVTRIIQEALSNVRKHARAGEVTAVLREWQGSLVIEIRDDGLGFEAADVPEIARHGLRGMRERAEMIGADFQITSQAGKGTTVSLVLPSYLEERTIS